MPIPVECRFCGKAMIVGNEVAGKRFRCPGCLEIIEAPSEAPQIPRPAARPAELQATAKKKAPPQPSYSESSSRDKRPGGNSGRNVIPKPSHDVVSQIWAVSSYDYPEVPVEIRERKTARRLRDSNPEAFAEFDRVVTECMRFLVGLGIFVAALSSELYFMDNAPADPERAKRIYTGTMIFAAGCAAAGLLCLTRWRVVLIFVAIISAIAGAWLLLIAAAFFKLLIAPGLVLALVCTRLITAVQRYPDQA